MKKVKVQICRSCLKELDLSPELVRDEVAAKLQADEPDTKFKVKIVSCMDLCPRKNVAIYVKVKDDAGKRETMKVAEAANPAGITVAIERFSSPQK